MQNPGIPHDALVLVGDGERALFFRNHGSQQDPELTVEAVLQQENPATRDQGTDRPGRLAGGDGTSASAKRGVQRSAVEDTDWHQLGEDRFTKNIADALYQLAHANHFERLIIVAPPRVLGTLRKALHKEVLDRIQAEVPKELATDSVPEIQTQLKRLLH